MDSDGEMKMEGRSGLLVARGLYVDWVEVVVMAKAKAKAKAKESDSSHLKTTVSF